MTAASDVSVVQNSEWANHWRVVLGAAIGMGTAFSLYQYP
jgi:hypothetical protein